tara:strand:- start:723 stop:1466 length:744 start_codon:yes stop_codon:yes gene_type:complete
MPTNLGHEAISALKVGHSSVTAAYAGHQQIFPNTTEIQSAAFTSTAGMSNTGGSRIFRVTGDIGSAYNLTGYGAGSYTITSSPYDHTVSVGLNNDCTDPNRTIATTLTPTGNTILQGGGSSFTSSFTQNGGPGINNYNANPSISVTNTNYVTTTVGGNLYWAPGAAWSISWSYNGTYATHSTSGMSIGVSGSTRSGDYSGSGSSDSGTWTFTLGSGVSSLSTVNFYLIIYSAGCNEAPSAYSGYLYP